MSEPADPWEGQGHGDLMIRLGAKMNRAGPDSPLWMASPLSLGETRELFGVIADLSLRLREAAADQARLRLFVGRFIAGAREHGGSDIDGGDAQDWMLEAGLLEKREVSEACGEGCVCAEWDSFPQTCNFVTPFGQRCLDAARPRAGGWPAELGSGVAAPCGAGEAVLRFLGGSEARISGSEP